MKIVFFDGYCGLCDYFVAWLVAHDQKRLFKFASLQGETSRSLPEIIKSGLETVIYLRGEKQFEKSDAVLMILSDLGGVASFAKILFVIPKAARDFIYNQVAKNRYRIFGKRKTCRLPTAEEQERFLP